MAHSGGDVSVIFLPYAYVIQLWVVEGLISQLEIIRDARRGVLQSTMHRVVLCQPMTHFVQLSSSQMMGVLAKRVFPRAWNLPYPSVATAIAAAATEDKVSEVRHSASNSATAASTIANETLDQSLPPPVRPRGVFHVSIAQCYDKKLEASRKDFRHQDLDGDAEVDLVLTTAEVLELVEESASAAGATLASASPSSPSHDATSDYFRRHCPPGNLAEPLAPGFPVGQAAVSVDGLSLFGGVDGEGAADGNSGGYLEHVFRHAAVELFGVDLAGKPLVYREGRNADFRETSLEVRLLATSKGLSFFLLGS